MGVGHMIRRLLPLLLCCASTAVADNGVFNGRWIIQPLGENNGRVMWLEIDGAGTGAVTGAMVGGGPGGQLDEVLDARIQRGQLSFRLDRRLGRDRKYRVQTPVIAAFHDGRLLGAALRNRAPLLWVGERAPEILDRDDGSWHLGTAVDLFNGSDGGGWHTLRPGREDGDLVVDDEATQEEAEEHAAGRRSARSPLVPRVGTRGLASIAGLGVNSRVVA